MAKLGAAVDYDPFAESSSGFTLGAPVDYDPFGPPDEQPLNLPPLSGTPAPGIPLPPIPERAPPLPIPRPADLVQQAQAEDAAKTAEVQQASELSPYVDPLMPIGGDFSRSVTAETQPKESLNLSDIPGAPELKQRVTGANLMATVMSSPKIEDQRATMQRLVEEGKLTQDSLDFFNKLHPPEAAETAATEAKKAKEEVKALPTTDFDKKWEQAQSASEMAKVVADDPAGFVTKFAVKPTVTYAPETIAAIFGAPAAMIAFAAGSYADGLNKAVTDRGGKLEDPKQFKKVYQENQDEIQKEASEKAAIAGAGGAAMGLIPGGESLPNVLGNLFIKYPAIMHAQTLAQREVEMTPVIGEDGQPVVGADGKVQMRPAFREPGTMPILGTQPMTGKEMLESYLGSVVPSAAFEAPKVVRGISEGRFGRPAAEEGAPPQEPTTAPKAPNDEAVVFTSYKQDIDRGNVTKEDVLSRIARMSPDELAERARITRQVGGKELKAEPLSADDEATLTKLREPAPVAPTSPEQPVEAPGAEPTPPPEAAPAPAAEAPAAEAAPAFVPAEADIAVLKGAGYDVADILGMSPSEVKAEVRDAREAQIAPAELTPEDRALIDEKKPATLGAPVDVPVEDLIAPAQPAPPPAVEEAPVGPAPRATELVKQGVPPLEAMKEAGAAPIEAAPIEAAPVAAAEPIPAAEPTPAPEPAAEATPEPEIKAAPIEPAANVPRVEVNLPFALKGGETEVKVGDTYLPARYAVVDAENLKATLGKAVNQFRDRERMGSKGQIEKIANAPDWNQLNAAPVMDFGSPTLDRNGLIVGGNGRFEGLSRAYDRGTANNYRRLLQKNAGQFGVDPATFAKMKKPVLMRIIEADVDTGKLALASNEGAGLRMSMLEQAKVDSQRLPDLGILRVGDNGEISAAGNRDLIKSWTKEMPATEIGGIVDAQGALSQEGLVRLRNAVMHKAYGDSPTLGRIIESLDQGSKNIAAALIRSAPRSARAKELIASGDLYNLDLTNDILDAAEKFEQLRNEGQKIKDYLNQGQMFGSDISPESRKILQFFGDHMRSAKSMSELFNKYLDKVEAVGNPKQAGMFGEEAVPTKGELLDAALQDTRKVIPAAEAELPFGEAAPVPAAEAAPEPEVKAAPVPKEKPAPAPAQQEKPGKIPGTELYIEAISSKDLPENLRPDLKRSLLERYFKPGAIVPAYGGKDRVVRLDLPKDLYNWSVEVKEVFDDGTVGRLRRHSSFPDPSEFRKLLGRDYDNSYVIRGDLDNNKKILDDLGFKPVRTVKGVKQRIFIGENPTDKIKEYAASGEIKKAPEAKKVISNVSEAETGKPFETTLYRGEPKAGESKKEFAYPILGGARYTTPNKDYAKSYGSDIKEIKVSLKNPLVIDNDTQWRNLTKSAGWKFPNPFGRPNDEIVKNVEDLKKIILSQGHDGVIVHIPKYKGFADESVAKTLANVFDEDTVVEYKVPKAAENVAPVAEAVPAREPSKATKSPSSFNEWMKAKEQFSKSPNMPQEYLDVLADWATMLGMKQKIHLMFDSKDTKNFDFGPAVKKKLLTSNIGGERIYYPSKNASIIRLNLHPRKTYNLEIIAHELGHAFESESWDKASKEDRSAVIRDYQKFLTENKLKNVENYIKALRPHVTGKITQISPSFRNAPSRELKPYWRLFEEYFADQVAKYMMSEKRPQTIVGKYFARIADGLKRLYESLAGMSGKARKSMKDYIDRRVNEADGVLHTEETPMEAEAGPEVVNEARSSVGEDTIDEINKLNEETGMPKEARPEQPKAPDETNLDKLRALIQDDKIFLRKVQENIEQKRNAPLPDFLNVYTRMMLMPGRTSERIHSLNENEIKPFFKKMKELGVTPDELHKYRLALHAPERNKRMAEINPKEFGAGGGSGLTDKAAEILLERAKPRETELNTLNDMLTKIINNDLDRRVEAGLISKEQADGFRSMYEHYVPLRGYAERDFEEDFPHQQYNLGKGTTVSKEEYRKAMGRKSLSDNVVFNAIMQAEEGLYRIEKNRAAKSLYNLAKTYKIPELWNTGKMKAHKVIGEDGLVKWELDGMVGPDTIVAKIGGKPVYVDLKHPSLAAAFGRTGAVTMAKWFRPIAQITRGWSALQTSKNPAFIATNFQRDLADAITYAYSRDPKLAAELIKSLPEALNITTRASFGKMTDEQRKKYDEFRLSGAKISFNAIQDIAALAHEWEKYADDATPAKWYNLPAKSKKAAEKAFNGVVRGLDKLISPFEDGVRASVFIAARKIMKPEWYKLKPEERSSLSDEAKEAYHKYTLDQAASIAQEASVNFYRKGKWSPYLNGLYAFFNASTQGAATGLRILKNSKRARLAFLALIPLSFMNTIRNLGSSDDDPTQKGRKNYNNIPDWERQNSIIIKTGRGPKDYFRIRMPSILTIPLNIGEQAALIMTGQKKAGDAVGNIVGNTVNAFNPLGSNSIIGAIAPTILDPLADILVNKKYSGAPIHPKPAPWNVGIPNSDQAFSNTAPWASMLSKTIYKGTAGAVDIYPGDAEHVADWMFSGLAKNSGNVVSFMNDVRQGKDAKIADLPIVKTFAPSSWSPATRYYELHDDLEGKVNVLREKGKELAKSPTLEKYKEFNSLASGTGIYFDGEKANTSNVDALKAMKNTDSVLKELRQASINVQNDPKLSPAAKQKRVDAIKLQMERAMVAAGQQMSVFDPRPSFAPLSSWINRK